MAIHRGFLPGDNYTPMPNHWSRDPRLTYKAKGIMHAIATHSIDYRLTVDQLISEGADGKAAVYAGVKELVDLGYLTRTQGRGEKGRVGEVDYDFGPAAYEQSFERNWGVSAGRTASRFSASGQSASGESESKKDQGKKDHFEENPLPPTPQRTETPEPVVAESSEGGEDNDGNNNTYVTPGQQAIVDRVRTLQPGWTQQAIVQVLNDAVASGRGPQLAGRALEELAEGRHGATQSPRRLLADGPWWTTHHIPQTTRTAQTTAQCREHPGEPAHNCRCCRSEIKTGERTEMAGAR